jgi:DNA-directed RNA polymerase subunit K/omega
MPRSKTTAKPKNKTKNIARATATGNSAKTTKKNTKPESDNDEESIGEDKYKNNYDATAQNNGDEDDILVDGDIEEQDDDWEQDKDEDVEDGGEEAPDIEGDVQDDCPYNVTRKTRGVKKVSANIDKDDEDDDETTVDVNADENVFNPDLYVKPDDRRSKPFLINFERVRLLGDRTAQLAQDAKPMIRGVDGMDPRVVAQLELESKMIPIKIIRPLPNGKKEIWSLNELQLKKKYIMYNFTGGLVNKQAVEKMEAEYKKGGSIVGYSYSHSQPVHDIDNKSKKPCPEQANSSMHRNISKNKREN